jgi:putative transposase
MPSRVELHEPDEETWIAGEGRFKVLSNLAAESQVTCSMIEDAARELGLQRSQCYELLRRYKSSPTVTALLPRVRGRAHGAKMLDGRVELVIEKAITEFYFEKKRSTLADLVRETARLCAQEGISAPSYNAIARRLRSRDQVEVLRRRSGARQARNKLGRIVGRLAEDQPLGLVQIDHTLADVMVVSSRDRRPLKRPWLTLAIDVATRMVAGFYLSLDAPSALSVALVLTHAVLPKDTAPRDEGIDIPWPVCGLPQRLHLDNAKEFHSQALARGTAQYGIDVQYRPPATPHWGGHIERLIGTMMGSLRLLPGATGANVAERGMDPEATAAMTLDELEGWMVHQIAGVYHHTVHRSLGRAPITAWQAGTATAPSARHPHNADEFFLDFLPFKQRMIQRSGLSLFNITYSDGVISTFLAKPRQKFIVRYDPRDLSQVYLRDQDGSYWPIPYSDLRLPPVTLSEVKAASYRLRVAGQRYPTQQQIFASVEQQRALVEQATVQTKLSRREQERTMHALRGGRAARNDRKREEPHSAEDDGPILPYPVEEWST